MAAEPSPLLTVARTRKTTEKPYDPGPDLDRAQRAYEKAERAWLAAAAERREAARRARSRGQWTWGQIAKRYKVNQHRAREIAHPRGK